MTTTKRALERRLSAVEGFSDPIVEREQYPTPADVAAGLIHLADISGDVADRTVVDLGTGTGMLAIGAALRSPERVLAIDIDPVAIRDGQRNERRVSPETPIEWIRADATRAPICPSERASPHTASITVVMNPPFGAQRGNVHADRAFLETAAEIGVVSYSIHNEGSQEFVEAFTADEGGEITHAYRVPIALERQFSFHDRDRREIETELYRIVWDSR